jgi:hypothetical protein
MTKSKVIEKIKFYATEKIEILPIRRTPKGHKYAVTNHGRVIRFGKDPAADGVLVKATVDVPFNYERVYIQNNGKRTSVLVHRLVAQFFLPKPEKGQLFIIHKDRNNRNNHPSNLKWVTKEEHVRHAMAGENWKKGRQSRSQVYKLTEDRVRLIRKKISEGKTRMKMIAKQVKVSEMQIYRIQSGENWGWVK